MVIFGSLYGLLSLAVWRADCIVRGLYANLRRGEEFVKEGSIELENEIIECTCAEETLREAHYTLEQLAMERTVNLETEIVERKRTEEALAEREAQLRLVADNVPLLISYVDAERRLRFSNKKYENWYGISPDRLEGCQLREIIGDIHYREIQPHVDAALSGRSGRFETRTAFPTAGSRDIETSYVPHLGEDGKVKGFFVLINDFTERKRVEERLRTAKEQADIANRAKSEFLATISHELLTPLNAVIGFSEMITCETFGPIGNPKYSEYAADIQLSGQHLLELITDILDLSKVEVGVMELDEEWIEIPAIIRCVVTLARKPAERNGIKLEVNCPDDSPALHVDRRKLKKILINLLSNGIKFTPPGGSVTLSVWCHADSGYVFQIVDSGIGIAPEDIRKVLAPFCQVDGDLSRKYEGLGLGLPLAKALVELHGGSLSIESHVDIGTTATVSLPAQRIASHDATVT